MTLENLILDAFDQLDPFFSDSTTISSKKSSSGSAGVDYKALKILVSKALEEQKASTVKRFLPPTLTPQTLARLMGQANVCWVLEDFHKLEDVEKPRLAQVMKVFMDEGDQHPHLKIVALGAVDTARQVVEFDAEMRHRVAEIHVPLSLKKFLSALQTDQRGSLLRFDQASARYSFRDPIFRTVAKLRGDKPAAPPARTRGAVETRGARERKQQKDFARLVQAVVSDLGWELHLTRRPEDNG